MKRINSIDGCNERDHELGFSIGLGTIKTYFGRDIYEDRRREYTDDEDKIEDRTNLDTIDNVFCPECEKLFSNYEGRYSQTYNLTFEKDLTENKKVSGQEAALFWYGIIWRLSATEHFGIKLNSDFEEKLRKIVFSQKIEDYDIYYALYYCKGYRTNNPTFALFDCTGDVAMLIVDEFLIAVFNGEMAAQSNEVLWGLNFKCNVPKLNDGFKQERIGLLPKQFFGLINNSIMHQLLNRIDFRGKFDALHNYLFDRKMPDEIYKEVMEEIGKAKLGDR